MNESSPKTVLVLGATGFIGRYISRYFVQRGWRVVGVGRSSPENAPLADLTVYHRLDLPDPRLVEVIRDCVPDVCIHCAGRASVGLSMQEPAADFYAGTVLLFEVLNALRLNAPDCRLIFLSSAAVYGNPRSLPIPETHPPEPLSPYGFHKWQGELLCQEFTQIYGLKTASVRIFSAYGAGLRRQVVWDICQKAIAQPALLLQGSGQESRDFIHALDIARALDCLVTAAPFAAEVYNLGTGEQVTIATLAEWVLAALDRSRSIQSAPQFDGQVPPGTPRNWQADISKIAALGFVPSVAIEKGVASVAHWCRMELLGV